MSKAEKKRALLMYAARNCFEMMGYENVRVEDITERVGVAKGSFYYYFTDKQDIVLALMEEEVAEYVRHISEAVSGTPDGIAGLTLMLKAMLTAGQDESASAGYFHEEIPGWFHSQYDECRNRHMLPLCRDIAWRCVREKLVRVPHVEMVAELLYLGSAGWMHLYHDKMDDPEFAKNALAGMEVFFNRVLDPVRKIELADRV